MDEALESIDKFVKRHYGKNPKDFTKPVIISGIGIGGQTTCCVPVLGFVVNHKNRQLYVCDSLGTNYKALEEEWLNVLRENPDTKLLWVVGSKSGGTDETMVNFQMNLKTMIRVWARYRDGDEKGVEIAEALLEKLFDGKALSEKTISRLNLNEEELEILRIVFKNLVIVTGSKESGSRLARLMEEAFLNELYDNKEDRVISILMLDNLGGRFQGISPNAFVYNALLGLDIRKMLESAKEVATLQRTESLYRSKKVAIDLWLDKIQQLLIAIPNDIIFGRLSEALGQMVPESTGKGRRFYKEGRLSQPVGIQTYAYDSAAINNAFKDIKPAGKAYLVLDIEGNNPMQLDKEIIEDNYTINYKLKEISETELAKLIQFMEDITANFGMFNTAEALLDTQQNNPELQGIDLFNKNSIVEVIKGAKHNEDGDLFNKFREVFDEITPFRQPDVEFAKALVKGGLGVSWFNQHGNTDKDKLPLRDQTQREAEYNKYNKKVSQGAVLDLSTLGLRDENRKYRTGKEAEDILLNLLDKISYQPHAPPIADNRNEILILLDTLNSLQETILQSGIPQDTYEYIQELKQQRNQLFTQIINLALNTKLNPTEEQTARQLAALLLKAHQDNKSLNFVLYEDRNPLTEIIKKFAEFLGLDRFDFGPAEQHKSFQLTSGGIDVSLEVLIQSVKQLEKIEATEELIVYDGCVPNYLHGLYPSEVGTIYLRAYADRFKEDQVQTEVAVLMAKDLTEKKNIADLTVLLTKTVEIYNATESNASSPARQKLYAVKKAISDLRQRMPGKYIGFSMVLTSAGLIAWKPFLAKGLNASSVGPLLISLTKPNQYFAELVYTYEDELENTAFSQLRYTIRDYTRKPVMLGIGPIYQHSNGQMYNDEDRVNIIMFTVKPKQNQDLPIPAERYTFGELMFAQAEGNRQGYAEKSRNVIRVDIENDEQLKTIEEIAQGLRASSSPVKIIRRAEDFENATLDRKGSIKVISSKEMAHFYVRFVAKFKSEFPDLAGKLEGLFDKAIPEIFKNAIEHGNEFDSVRYVTLAWDIDEERVTIKISDQGRGTFKAEMYLNMNEEVAEDRRRIADDLLDRGDLSLITGSGAGLGIYTAKQNCDRIEYRSITDSKGRKIGTEVTIVGFLSSSITVPSSSPVGKSINLLIALKGSFPITETEDEIRIRIQWDSYSAYSKIYSAQLITELLSFGKSSTSSPTTHFSSSPVEDGVDSSGPARSKNENLRLEAEFILNALFEASGKQSKSQIAVLSGRPTVGFAKGYLDNISSFDNGGSSSGERADRGSVLRQSRQGDDNGELIPAGFTSGVLMTASGINQDEQPGLQEVSLTSQSARSPPVLKIIPAFSAPVQEQQLLGLAEAIGEGIRKAFPFELRVELSPAVPLERIIADLGGSYNPISKQYILPFSLSGLNLEQGTPTLIITDADLTGQTQEGGLKDFLFGRTYPAQNITISSAYRFSSPQRGLFIARNIKNAIHEAGHLFGLGTTKALLSGGQHCANPACAIHFTPTPEELDRVTTQFCPACRSKLAGLFPELVNASLDNGGAESRGASVDIQHLFSPTVFNHFTAQDFKDIASQSSTRPGLVDIQKRFKEDVESCLTAEGRKLLRSSWREWLVPWIAGISDEEIDGILNQGDSLESKLAILLNPGEFVGKNSVLQRIIKIAESVRKDGSEAWIHNGVGGSILPTQSIVNPLLSSEHNSLSRSSRGQAPRVYYSGDSFSPERPLAVLKALEDQGILFKAKFNIISKSGTTGETIFSYLIYRAYLQERLRDLHSQEHKITDEELSKMGLERKDITPIKQKDIEEIV
ncbi:MAG: hypothetical protein DRP74_07725, partial [Candidatus Omnitrophota bacterium]